MQNLNDANREKSHIRDADRIKPGSTDHESIALSEEPLGALYIYIHLSKYQTSFFLEGYNGSEKRSLTRSSFKKSFARRMQADRR